jgi:undecaprenyl-diphosphatase
MPGAELLRVWSLRLGLVIAGTCLVAALVPLLAGLDEQLFLALNGPGTDSELFQAVMDPHTRNYVIISLLAIGLAALRGPRAMSGAALAVLAAALLSDVLVQVVYVLYERARPEEVLGAQALLPEGRHWAHIASFPSGHMVVTTAIAVAAMSMAPVLRRPLWVYVVAIGLTRVALGAHFPLDVLVGCAFGYQVGRFAAALPQLLGLAAPAEADALGWRVRPAEPQVAVRGGAS